MWHCCWVVLTFFIHTISPLTGIVALSAWFGCTANVLQTLATVAGLPSSTTLQCLLSQCGASPQDAGCGMHRVTQIHTANIHQEISQDLHQSMRM